MRPFNNSAINLGISAEPDVSDPLLYQPLLELHNGLQNLLQAMQDYIDREKKIEVVSSTLYSMLSTDNRVLVNAVAASEVVLPSVSSSAGLSYTVKHIGAAFAVTITTEVGVLIDGASSKVLAAGEVVTLVADGTNWYSI